MKSIIPTLIFCWLACNCATAADNPVESGREALSSPKSAYPWYDKSKDAAKPILAPKPPKPRKPITTTGRMPNGLGVLLQIVGWTALAGLIAILCVLLARAFVFKEVAASQTTHVVHTLRQADKVEHLPFQIQADEGDFLGAARKYYEAGDYSRAIIYLFSYQLLQLDHHHVIRLAKGKTNRQYLRETRPRPELKNLLEMTMVAFEDVFFGHHPLDRARFEECWNELPRFQQQLPAPEAV